MPYIKQFERDELDEIIDELVAVVDGQPPEGGLNYIITRLLTEFYGNSGDTRYRDINNAMGLLTCVQQEFYRKVAGPYEDEKEKENGKIRGQ